MLFKRLSAVYLGILFSATLSFANEHGGDDHGGGGGGGHDAPAAAAQEIPPEPEEEVDPSFKLLKVTDNPDDIQVPSQVFEHLFVETKAHLVFVPVSVSLIEKNQGILKDPKIRVQFPRGGGAIDLTQFTTGKQGSFFVNFRFEPSAPKGAVKVFFVSQGRKRKLDGEVHGAGCKTLMDVTKGLLEHSKKDGILVNTTRFRHLSVLGGHFIFATIYNKEIHLSQVTFTDSVHPEYFCSGRQKDKKDESASGL